MFVKCGHNGMQAPTTNLIGTMEKVKREYVFKYLNFVFKFCTAIFTNLQILNVTEKVSGRAWIFRYICVQIEIVGSLQKVF